jgi:threonyl-tRNA synthetase
VKEQTVERQVAGETVELDPGLSLGEALGKVVSKKRMKKVVAARVEGELRDLAWPVGDNGAAIEPVFDDEPEGLEIVRHSAAHLMAEAVKRLFPEAKVTIGPAVENGFYYDFDYDRPFTPEDLEAIEKEMGRIASQNLPFACRRVSKEEAMREFGAKGETYKIELMEDIEDREVSLYEQGDFVDLCRGPHVPATSYLKAFKLMSVAGAYWRGDENNKQLQRIYGTAWPTPKELKQYLVQLEEAKKRDHRKLGTQLDLFSFHEEAAAGMVFWHPKGALVRTILEDFLRKEHLKRGYQLVQGPQILKRDLWERSGHYDNYRENMYFTEIDEQVYGVKPMNCLAHMLIFGRKVQSYRDLPERYFELGVVHRHEKSGVMHGLLRVRQFTQDDAHILCTPEQLKDEILGVMNWVRDLMRLFGFEYKPYISTRPEKAIGTQEDWDRATAALVDALESTGVSYEINEGDGAFYGPKIDIIVEDAIGRNWQLSTIQCDFTLPERFDLVYVAPDGERRRPVMIHRAITGSLERFMGVLIEHYAGAFPTWLAPLQARVLTITDAQNDFAEQVARELKAAGIRCEADTRNEKLSYKVREAQVEKVPFMLVVGDKEVEAGGVNVRTRSGENLGVKTIAEVISHIVADSTEPFQRGGMSYSF